MTVEFHNPKIRMESYKSLNKVGFIKADVRTLDEKQGSFKQVTTTSALNKTLSFPPISKGKL